VSFKTLLIAAGVLALVFGLGFFFAPVGTLNLYGAATGPVGYLMTRFFGAELIQVGVAYILIRGVQEPSIVRGIAIGTMLGALAGLRVSLYAVRNDMVNQAGWSSVAIYAVLVLAFGWYAFRRPRPV
jgi:hypothetical protein